VGAGMARDRRVVEPHAEPWRGRHREAAVGRSTRGQPSTTSATHGSAKSLKCSRTMVMVIYREAFFRFNLGSAAALSVVVLIVLVALNVLQLRILRRDRTESEPS
jgi:hypothetical protein